MTNEKYLKRIIRNFDRDEHKGSDLDNWAKIYGRRVFMRTLSRRATKSAKDGFMIGFLYARFLEGH